MMGVGILGWLGDFGMVGGGWNGWGAGILEDDALLRLTHPTLDVLDVWGYGSSHWGMYWLTCFNS